MKEYIEVLRKAVIDRGGDHLMSIRLLQEYGSTNGYFDKDKLVELWEVFKDHPVIFSDEIEGSIERFIDVVTDPLSIWFEVYDEIQSRPIGLYFLTDIYPGYDAMGHFAFADRIARNRERMSWNMMMIVFESYNLHRMSVEVPAYQTGTLRAAEALGFRREGIKVEAAKRRGKWVDVITLGILRSELEEKVNGQAA